MCSLIDFGAAFFDNMHKSDQYSVKMIAFVLDYLSSKAAVTLLLLSEAHIKKLHLDALMTCSRSCSRMRQTALLGVVGLGRTPPYHRIKHYREPRTVLKYNDTLQFAYHISRHSHALMSMRRKRIQKILRNA